MKIEITFPCNNIEYKFIYGCGRISCSGVGCDNCIYSQDNMEVMKKYNED